MADEIDKNIVKRINAGDKKAFACMYDAYFEDLCAISVFYVFDTTIACEIVNDVFLNVWDKRVVLLFPVKSYLCKAVRNRSLNYIRTARVKEKGINDLGEDVGAVSEDYTFTRENPFSVLEKKEAEHIFRQAIEQLPEKCRLIFKAVWYENKSYAEVAQQYHITPSTVRVQVRNALSRLKKTLKKIL